LWLTAAGAADKEVTLAGAGWPVEKEHAVPDGFLRSKTFVFFRVLQC
jgi:hypothetical protein